MKRPKIRVFGETAVLIEWPQTQGIDISQQILSTDRYIQETFGDVVIESTFSYNALVVYLKHHISSEAFIEMIDLNRIKLESTIQARPVFRVPVCYGGEFGPDIDLIAERKSLATSDVIQMHSHPVYDVRFIGFLPGFPYLSGLDERLHMARRSTPRLRITRGSVAIGGTQTGIYTIDSPGGWHIIGKCPLDLFSVDRIPPVLFDAGDRLKFEPISYDDFEQIASDVANGIYTMKTMADD